MDRPIRPSCAQNRATKRRRYHIPLHSAGQTLYRQLSAAKLQRKYQIIL